MTENESQKLDTILAHISDLKTSVAVVESKQDASNVMLEKQNGRVGKAEDEIILLKERTKDIPDIAKRVLSLETFKVKVVAGSGVVATIAGGAADYLKHKFFGG